MKAKLLNQFVCFSGILFMTFPAWSAVPATRLGDAGLNYQLPSETDEESLPYKNGMILAKGGGEGGNGGGGDGGGDFFLDILCIICYYIYMEGD